MRKEATINNNVTLSRVSGYHDGDHARRLYFRSDRAMVLDYDYRRPDGQPLRGYGLEIESECFDFSSDILAELYDKIIFTHFPADLFKMERDGSLSGGHNAECITQIMTKAFIRNHYKDFKTMYDTYFPAFNISCSRTGNCGMHVNVSNACFGKDRETQDDAIRKLFYFINHNFSVACKLFARDERHTGYCSQMSCGTIESAKRYRLTGRYSDHGISYNLGHYEQGRVEIRLVGGQSGYYCFRNTMETVFWLVEHIHTVPWEKLDDMRYVFRGCNQYVIKRLTDCGLSYDVLNDIIAHKKEEDLELHTNARD